MSATGTPDVTAKPVLAAEELLALDALERANGFRLEKSAAEGEDTLYYVIDTSKAEPEVNHPGEYVAGPVPLEVAIAVRKQRAAREMLDFARKTVA